RPGGRSRERSDERDGDDDGELSAHVFLPNRTVGPCQGARNRTAPRGRQLSTGCDPRDERRAPDVARSPGVYAPTAATSSTAAPATASGVIPRRSSTSGPGAEAPKRSIETLRSTHWLQPCEIPASTDTDGRSR